MIYYFLVVIVTPAAFAIDLPTGDDVLSIYIAVNTFLKCAYAGTVVGDLYRSVGMEGV